MQTSFSCLNGSFFCLFAVHQYLNISWQKRGSTEGLTAAAPASVKELMNILLHDAIRTFTLIIHRHCAPFFPPPAELWMPRASFPLYNRISRRWNGKMVGSVSLNDGVLMKLLLLLPFPPQSFSWSCWRTPRNLWEALSGVRTRSSTRRTPAYSRTCSPSWSATTPAATWTWRRCSTTSGRGCSSTCSSCSTRSTTSTTTIWSASASTWSSWNPSGTFPGTWMPTSTRPSSPRGPSSRGWWSDGRSPTGSPK